MTLAEKLLALHRALAARRIPHAFGGAIALAYWTLNPRGTSDIDVNVFVPAQEAPKVLAALPAGVSRPDGTAEAIDRDGQVRLWWEDTPIDLFFRYAPIHDQAASNRQTVDFSGSPIPVLGPNELTVFKVMFDRVQDWADIDALVANDVIDRDTVVEALRPMLPGDDPRLRRWDEAISRGKGTGNSDPPGVPADEIRPREEQ